MVVSVGTVVVPVMPVVVPVGEVVVLVMPVVVFEV